MDVGGGGGGSSGGSPWEQPEGVGILSQSMADALAPEHGSQPASDAAVGPHAAMNKMARVMMGIWFMSSLPRAEWNAMRSRVEVNPLSMGSRQLDKGYAPPRSRLRTERALLGPQVTQRRERLCAVTEALQSRRVLPMRYSVRTRIARFRVHLLRRDRADPTAVLRYAFLFAVAVSVPLGCLGGGHSSGASNGQHALPVPVEDLRVDEAFTGSGPDAGVPLQRGGIPTTPEPWQKRPPCDEGMAERAVNGACYFLSGVLPPCGRLLEYRGACYRAIRMEPPSPVSSP